MVFYHGDTEGTEEKRNLRVLCVSVVASNFQMAYGAIGRSFRAYASIGT